jgi:hypothetical protein
MGVEAGRTTTTASNVLLVSGYTAATWGGLKLLPALRGREPRRLAAFQAGTACVTAGLMLRRRWISAGLNAGALAGTGLLRALLGRRARR